MAKKFQELEAIFSDRDYCRHLRREDGDDGGGGEDYYNCRRAIVAAPRRMYRNRTASDGGRQTKKEMASSLPVRIPERIGRRMAEEDDETDGEEMALPPHVVAERRGARKMAFSVCSGNGRTLKGRDLSRVRNTILRMTGFLET